MKCILTHVLVLDIFVLRYCLPEVWRLSKKALVEICMMCPQSLGELQLRYNMSHEIMTPSQIQRHPTNEPHHHKASSYQCTFHSSHLKSHQTSAYPKPTIVIKNYFRQKIDDVCSASLIRNVALRLNHVCQAWHIQRYSYNS